jgi:hypothetical protein
MAEDLAIVIIYRQSIGFGAVSEEGVYVGFVHDGWLLNDKVCGVSLI